MAVKMAVSGCPPPADSLEFCFTKLPIKMAVSVRYKRERERERERESTKRAKSGFLPGDF
jgi:NADH:ubiquinone oxidoreductase subunit B-like Fe-S oxidoreductase